MFAIACVALQVARAIFKIIGKTEPKMNDTGICKVCWITGVLSVLGGLALGWYQLQFSPLLRHRTEQVDERGADF
jgi:hypothetical protein